MQGDFMDYSENEKPLEEDKHAEDHNDGHPWLSVFVWHSKGHNDVNKECDESKCEQFAKGMVLLLAGMAYLYPHSCLYNNKAVQEAVHEEIWSMFFWGGFLLLHKGQVYLSLDGDNWIFANECVCHPNNTKHDHTENLNKKPSKVDFFRLSFPGMVS